MLLDSLSSMVKCCHFSLTNRDAKNDIIISLILVAILKGNTEKFKNGNQLISINKGKPKALTY